MAATTTQRAARQAAIKQNGNEDTPDVEKGVRLAGVLQITAPSFRIAKMRLVGTSPLVMNKFSEKARQKIEDDQASDKRGGPKPKRVPKDFNALYEAAKHISREGWVGVPASAFRKAMISACRLVNFKMTLAKLSVFIEADGYDVDEGTPLIRIIKGEPHPFNAPVRLASGACDIRCRPMWDEWEIIVRVRFDNDVFSLLDIVNLMTRVGSQVGVMEGHLDSKNSAGMGWGSFKVEEVIHDGQDSH